MTEESFLSSFFLSFSCAVFAFKMFTKTGRLKITRKHFSPLHCKAVDDDEERAKSCPHTHLCSQPKQSFMKGDFDEIVNNLWTVRKGRRSSYVY